MTPSTNWKEVIPDGEPAHLEELAQRLLAMQRRAARGGTAMRGLHAKGKVGVEAEFTVLADVPEHARIGLFATPRTYRAYVRYSNGVGRKQPDTKPDVRGIAVKLVGVEGAKIIPGLEQAKTQDFLLIRSPSTPFRSADEFIWFVEAAQNPATLLPKALGRFGIGRGFRMIRQLLSGLSEPMVSLATTPYFSALPVKFGPYAAKYALTPHATSERKAIVRKTPEYLAEELRERLREGTVSYDFRVQFFRDEATTPVEDSSKEWPEADAPFVTLGRLTLGKQDLSTARSRAIAGFIESLSFDMWHTTEEFRPLGNMNRARNVAYRLSTQERKAAREPDGTERFDGPKRSSSLAG